MQIIGNFKTGRVSSTLNSLTNMGLSLIITIQKWLWMVDIFQDSRTCSVHSVYNVGYRRLIKTYGIGMFLEGPESQDTCLKVILQLHYKLCVPYDE